MLPERIAWNNPGNLVVIDLEGCWDQEFVLSDPFDLRTKVDVRGEIAIRSSSCLVIASAIAALDGWASSIHLVPPDVDPLMLENIEYVSEFRVCNTQKTKLTHDDLDTNIESNWILYTSGTTGKPKPIAHKLASLTRTVSKSKVLESMVWGMIYDPNRMAGIQVLLQAMCSKTAIVAPDPRLSLNDRIRFMKEKGVNAVSATPTLWRQILQCPESDNWNLVQVTLGGEIADQKVLDALSKKFKGARVAHIFASTETGAAFAVSDGKAGFPKDYLNLTPRGIQLEIRENILYIQNNRVNGSPEDEFISTGDVVEIVGDRVFFKGRASGQVNIGGLKVWPEVVENLIRTHPSVEDVRVIPKSNPFSGTILTAQVVSRVDHNEVLPSEIRKWMSSVVEKQSIPAVITIVDSLETTLTGKVERK